MSMMSHHWRYYGRPMFLTFFFFFLSSFFPRLFLSCGFFFCIFLSYGHYVIGQTIIFLPCDFYLVFPRLSGRRFGAYHILLCANSECMSKMCCTRAARWKYTTQKWRKKSPFGHHRTILSCGIFATKARIDNRKKLVKQQYLPHMSSQYDMIWWTILTCAQKLTCSQLSLPHGNQTKKRITKKLKT